VTAKLLHQASGVSYDLAGISILGRGIDCTVQIPDVDVSRRHAMIRPQSDGFWFFDLGSFNGSYINGSRVTTAEHLETGDLIRISDVSFRFEHDRPPPSSMDEFEAATIARIRSEDALLLVTDIQGFSGISELLSPHELAPIIGSWYARTEEALSQHGATGDKFLGDSALAYWTDTSPQTRLLALDAAGALRRAAEEIDASNREIFDRVGARFGVGIAMHRGRVAYGGMSAREFTILGDPVNIVFRMEALTRTLGCPLIVSAEFLEDWPEGQSCSRALGEHPVKGRMQLVDLYAVENAPAATPGAID